MTTLITLIHVVTGIALILIVLLQTGRGADMGVAFGGSSQTLFGSAGPASFLGKLTAICAFLFIVTSLSLTYLSTKQHSQTVFSESKEVFTPPSEAEKTLPAEESNGATPSKQEKPEEN